MLDGGIIPRRPYLIVGPSGSGKSTLALQFLCEGVRRGERGLLVTLEEPPNEARLNHRGLGPEFDRVEVFDAIPDVMRYERVPFKDISAVRASLPFGQVPFVIRRTPELTGVEVTITALEQMLRSEVTRRGFTRVVIDSLTALQYFCMKGFNEVAGAQTFLRYLSDLQVTTLLTVESPIEDADTTERMLARGEIRLFRWEHENATVRAIGVEKFRGSSHDIRLHPYRIGPQGIDINLTVTISRDTRQIIEGEAAGAEPATLTSKYAGRPLDPLIDQIRDLVAIEADVGPIRAEVEAALGGAYHGEESQVSDHIVRASALAMDLAGAYGSMPPLDVSKRTAEASAALMRVVARASEARAGIAPTLLPAHPELERQLELLLSILPSLRPAPPAPKELSTAEAPVAIPSPPPSAGGRRGVPRAVTPAREVPPTTPAAPPSALAFADPEPSAPPESLPTVVAEVPSAPPTPTPVSELSAPAPEPVLERPTPDAVPVPERPAPDASPPPAPILPPAETVPATPSAPEPAPLPPAPADLEAPSPASPLPEPELIIPLSSESASPPPPAPEPEPQVVLPVPTLLEPPPVPLPVEATAPAELAPEAVPPPAAPEPEVRPSAPASPAPTTASTPLAPASKPTFGTGTARRPAPPEPPALPSNLRSVASPAAKGTPPAATVVRGTPGIRDLAAPPSRAAERAAPPLPSRTGPAPAAASKSSPESRALPALPVAVAPPAVSREVPHGLPPAVPSSAPISAPEPPADVVPVALPVSAPALPGSPPAPTEVPKRKARRAPKVPRKVEPKAVNEAPSADEVARPFAVPSEGTPPATGVPPAPPKPRKRAVRKKKAPSVISATDGSVPPALPGSTGSIPPATEESPERPAE